MSAAAVTETPVDSTETPNGNGRGPRRGPRRMKHSHIPENARRLTVGEGTPVKKLAGAIAHTCRDADSPPPYMLAGRESGVNQAVKAIAVARGFLAEDGVDVTVFCELSNPSRSRNGFQFVLEKCPPTDVDQSEEKNNDLKVSHRSAVAKVAGAVAIRMRENNAVALNVIGPKSVFTAIDAISLARDYLAEDNIDVGFQPTFCRFDLSGPVDNVRSSGLRLTLVRRDLAPSGKDAETPQ